MFEGPNVFNGTYYRSLFKIKRMNVAAIVSFPIVSMFSLCFCKLKENFPLTIMTDFDNFIFYKTKLNCRKML